MIFTPAFVSLLPILLPLFGVGSVFAIKGIRKKIQKAYKQKHSDDGSNGELTDKELQEIVNEYILIEKSKNLSPEEKARLLENELDKMAQQKKQNKMIKARRGSGFYSDFDEIVKDKNGGLRLTYTDFSFPLKGKRSIIEERHNIDPSLPRIHGYPSFFRNKHPRLPLLMSSFRGAGKTSNYSNRRLLQIKKNLNFLNISPH